ncbi:MAG: hypothetical protein ACP5OL_06095, partial [Thermus sp.]
AKLLVLSGLYQGGLWLWQRGGLDPLKDRLLRFRWGKEVRRVRGHTRLLALMRWDRRRRLLWPWGGVAGEGYAPDPRLGGEVLRRFPPSGGWLLADAGFGGMKARLGGGYLWERKPWTAMARALLELIAYGLRVLLSLLPPPPGYKAIY